MGNCLVMEKKVIKIMRNDGKVLEYREPISVHHILTQFSGHSLFDNTFYDHQHHLLPDTKLISGHLYYLLPTTMNTKEKNIKKVTFANPEVEEQEEEEDDDDDGDDTGDESKRDENKNVSVVRMKIVVHKQELEKLLQGGSVHEMMYQSLEKQMLVNDDDDLECNRSWKPVLDSIPESDYLQEYIIDRS